MLNVVQFFFFFLHLCKEAPRNSIMRKYIYCKKDLLHENSALKVKAFMSFSINKRNVLVELSIVICEEQENHIEERRVQKRKKMPSEYKEDICLHAAEKIKRCIGIFEAGDGFRSKTNQRFNEINLSNETFSFLKSHLRFVEKRRY